MNPAAAPPRRSPRPCGPPRPGAWWLAAAAFGGLIGACSPAHRVARAPAPAETSASPPVRYFGDEYAERQQALLARPAEPVIEPF